MTTIHITVGNREQLREDALQFVLDVEDDDIGDQDGPTIPGPARYLDI
jgi:hypothetical protein